MLMLLVLLHRAVPIYMYFWEKLGYLGICGVSDGWVHWTVWAGILMDYKKGGRASANSCPQVASSDACTNCISQSANPCLGEGVG